MYKLLNTTTKFDNSVVLMMHDPYYIILNHIILLYI